MKTCTHGMNERYCPKCKGKMPFDAAAKFIIPFGKGKGKTIDEMAKTAGGLRWLDWLFGERAGQKTPFDIALKAYLEDDSIAKELNNLFRGDE